MNFMLIGSFCNDGKHLTLMVHFFFVHLVECFIYNSFHITKLREKDKKKWNLFHYSQSRTFDVHKKELE